MISPQIGIDPALKALWPEARLACLTWRTLPAPENPALWSFFTQEILPGLNATLQDTPLAELPNLGASRRAYKAFGRDPGRTRVSSEALYRRIRQGKGLYRINTALGCRNAFWDAMNYENVGGTPVLGVNAPVIIGHGCSSPQAIRSMILSTEQVIKADLTAKLQRAFQN